MNKETLQRLRELSAKASPTPWYWTLRLHDLWIHSPDNKELVLGEPEDQVNVELLTEMRNNLDPLLDHIEKLEKVVEAARDWDRRDTHRYTIDTSNEAILLTKALAELDKGGS